MPLGPSQQYIITYNGHQLPGYAQSEDDPTDMNINDAYAFGWDGSLSQYVGLSNKALKLTFRVWEQTYRTCKDAYHLATTILRSRREGFAPLFVDYTDRYFNATVKQVTYQQDISKSRRLLDYSVEFDCEPWWTSVTGYTITGAGSVNTDAVSRTLSHGGWTPAHVKVSGTDVTISGYTATEFTGFASISGVVTDFVIDTEHSRSYLGSGANGDGYMHWKNYGVWVGPDKTTWAVTGASAIEITYHNRWY